MPKIKPNKQRTIAPAKPKPTKVVQTMECTLAAKDKALQRIETKEGIVIKDSERHGRASVTIKRGTIVLVSPDKKDTAEKDYWERHKLSQEQSHIHQRKPVAKTKQKEHKSDLIFFH
jgi:hypothetical protein